MAKKQVLNNDAALGLVTSRDPSTLKVGELVEATGCEYRTGSPHLYKQPGRVDVGASLGGPVLAIDKCQFDEGDDVIVADANGTIFESAVSTSPTFTSSGLEGLSITAVPQYTGFKDRWIRCSGEDINYIREPDNPPGGTTGNWRPLGMDTSLSPLTYDVQTIDGGGQVLRPTTYTNTSSQTIYTGDDFGIGSPPDWTVISGYTAPVNAIDGFSGVGTGTVSGTISTTNLVGVGTTFLTQLTAGTSLTFSDGTTATVLSITSNTLLVTASSLSSTLAAGTTFTYSGSNSPYLAEGTGSTGNTGNNSHDNRNRTQRANRCVWKFTTNLAYTGRTLSVLHYSLPSPEWSGPEFRVNEMTVHLEYSLDAGVTYTTLGEQRFQNFPDKQGTTDQVSIADGVNISSLWIRSTVAIRPGTTDHDVRHVILDIKVSTGSVIEYTAENTLFYGVSEVYTDSDGIEHLSNMGTAIQVPPSSLQNATSLRLFLGAFVNPLATKAYIYRSVDAATGGVNAMYKIGTALRGDTIYIDNFSPFPSDITHLDTNQQFITLAFLYSTGENATSSFYTRPPLSFMTLPFQGSLVYLPSDVDKARRIYYSLPATVAVSAMEQVPELYYLDFQTPHNDQVKSAAVTNGGRSLLAFFENYTMLVNYLPMGSDPGGFNNTVKEFVSDVRGCVGRDACTEFTLPVGQTVVASVDGLGLWITNGVNMVDEWSEDIEWDALFSGVDLSTSRLIDNPAKRRLELVYTDADGAQQELHFFYGRMKQGVRNHVPLITGPHPSGLMSKFYTVIDTNWEGFSGSISDSGLVFHENDGLTDEANGYDGGGTIPFSFTGGDIYPEGLTRSNILEQINMKFSDGVAKTYDVNITMIRDKGSDVTVEKTFSAGAQQQIYVHKQLDRVRVQVQDLTATEASAFVGMAYEFRDSGISRDE